MVAVVLWPGDELGQHDLAAVRLHDVGAHHLVEAVVGALDQHLGADCAG